MHVQVGVDDECDLGYKQERSEEGETVLAGGSIPAIRSFLCNGAPGHLRLRLWMAALGHTSSHVDRPQGRFEGLCQQVELRPLFTDLLVRLCLCHCAMRLANTTESQIALPSTKSSSVVGHP